MISNKINSEEKLRIKSLVLELSEVVYKNDKDIYKVFKKYPRTNGDLFNKPHIIVNYRRLKKANELNLTSKEETIFLKNIKMKNVRTISGVTPVTVLTKPFPCPGKCIFCPNDVRMPKSYLSNEPGAQRAEKNKFDPYLQTFNRLLAFKNMGHSTSKVELLVLGGTWSVYPETYQIWFIKRCFDAMNDFENYASSSMLPVVIQMPYSESDVDDVSGTSNEVSYNKAISKALLARAEEAKKETSTWDELFASHKRNESSTTKCIGLVIETRPDEIDEVELLRIRKLGATRVQLGVQSLNDKVLSLNKRGHDVAKTAEAFKLLRKGGFKILAHWMPNLYGSNPQEDIEDFHKLFDLPEFKPDELKIYPCSLIESAELMKYYKKELWKPYSEAELLNVAVESIAFTPRYCRLTRVIRDIPSTDIVVGNKKTNFRQIAETEALKTKREIKNIRAREIRNKDISEEALEIKVTQYNTVGSTEYFIEYITSTDLIAGFIRLSLPNEQNFIKELDGVPIIRELHVYGKSLIVGTNEKESAQHKGLGKSLLEEAEKITIQNGFKKLAVISSIGTRAYYKKFGYNLVDLYQIKNL